MTEKNSYLEYLKTFPKLSGVGKQRLSWWYMLGEYVPKIGYSLPMQPRILSLGCGEFVEAQGINSYFGGRGFGSEADNVFITGIDIDSEKMKKAFFNCSYGSSLNVKSYELITGDARDLKKLVNEDFDVIIARQPDVAKETFIWHNIFKESYQIIKSDGLFIATSYSDVEHGILEEQVQNAGYKITLSTPNMYMIPLPHKDASIDRKVLFARK